MKYFPYSHTHKCLCIGSVAAAAVFFYIIHILNEIPRISPPSPRIQTEFQTEKPDQGSFIRFEMALFALQKTHTRKRTTNHMKKNPNNIDNGIWTGRMVAKRVAH